MLFGDFVHKLRIEREITLRDLGGHGLSPKRWSAVERNALAPSVEELAAARAIFTLSGNDLKRFEALAKLALNEQYPKFKSEQQLGKALPLFARSSGNEKPTTEQLQSVIDLTKQNY